MVNHPHWVMAGRLANSKLTGRAKAAGDRGGPIAVRRGRHIVPDDMQRAILPIPDRPYSGFVAYDAKDPDSGFPPIVPLDDVGFGASSAYGGPISTPTAERLAAGGLKYTRFHTTALCPRPARRC